MASALLGNSINALTHYTRIPIGHCELVPKKIPETHYVAKSPQPFTTKNRMARSHYNPSTAFQFEEYMAMKVKKINKALVEAVPLQHPLVLHEAMRYTILAGGKRVLPTICISACELVGGKESVAMPLACAVEMLMAMIVVQDDLPCLDNDDIRRGKPANHKVFGEGTSVLACQAYLCLALENIATKTKNVSPEVLVRAVVELCSALGSKGIAAGQIEDMNSEGKDVTLSELEIIHNHKTGKLLEATVVCGVLVGGGNETEIERLRKYGKYVGLAYQVWDDILDAIGSPEMGKRAGRDLLRDKATFPKLMGVDESKKYARELVARANEELVHFDSKLAAPLYHMANFIVSRRY